MSDYIERNLILAETVGDSIVTEICEQQIAETGEIDPEVAVVQTIVAIAHESVLVTKLDRLSAYRGALPIIDFIRGQ